MRDTPFVLHDYTLLHHEADMFQHSNVVQGVALNREDVGNFSGLYRPNFLG